MARAPPRPPRPSARRHALRAASAALLLAGGAPALAAPVSDAPLGVNTPGPFRALFLDLPLADARPAGERVRAEVRWEVANAWSVPTVLQGGGRTALVQEDAQTDALRVAVGIPWRRLLPGAPDGVSTTVELRAVRHWGGWSDRPIEAWHQLIRSWNFLREEYPRDRVSLVLEELPSARAAGGTFAAIRAPVAALGDVALRTAVPLVAGPAGRGDFGIGLRVDLKLPTGSPARLSGSGGWDAGLAVAGTVAPAPWLTGHAQLGLRVVSGLHGSPLQPRSLQPGAELSLVFRPWGRVALLAEDRVLGPLMQGGWSLPAGVAEPEATAYYALFRPHNQVTFGLRVDGFTAYVSEDFTPGPRLRTDPGPRWFYDSNAPDVVVGLAWAGGF